MIIYETFYGRFFYSANPILFNISGLAELRLKSVGNTADKAY